MLSARSSLPFTEQNVDDIIFQKIIAQRGVVSLEARTYELTERFYVPPSVIIHFPLGAKLSMKNDASIVWDGGIQAHSRQHIFDGNLVNGSYARIGLSPYKFSVIGKPQIDWASPYWFGARGDGVSDDTIALFCAQYLGGRQYLPSGQYAISRSLHLRQANQVLFGDGPASVIRAMANNIGQVIGLRGDPPTDASAQPMRYLAGATVMDLAIDGKNAENTNGIGGSFCRNCNIQNVAMQNIGRKGITLQYWCKGNTVSDIRITSALQEQGGTTAALSIEGQRSNLNFSLDGGTSRTADIMGWDCVDNELTRIEILRTTYRYLLITRARENDFSEISFGPIPGTRSDILLGPFAENNSLSNIARHGSISVCTPPPSNHITPAPGASLAVIPC
ncbi:glycosyl hydrolase family 28-related protein [Agrobacterium arsenijevicii]|uniref:glycosyl hydrolase family 28-related protein n=1 Tax=Agrobacterium arsenijevicii TaxID=1585697 RepID=UPI000A83E627